MINLSEFELIKRIKEEFPLNDKNVLGIGDDASFINNPSSILITTDAMVDKVHFLSKKKNFFSIGYKSLAVNISDIAAMGGIPEFFLLTLGIPPNLKDNDLEEIISGLKMAASEYKTKLIGGDTVSSGILLISITLIGKPLKTPILRRGAKKGDFIYVTGTIGDSFIGLSLLLGGKRFSVEDENYFINRHLYPTPRVSWMEKILKDYNITSAIDVSDGLIGDLIHIAEESCCGFELHIEEVPISENEIGKSYQKKPLFYLSYLLSGGEDYEIIFTSPDEIDLKKLNKEGIKVSKIGKITERNYKLYFYGKEIELGAIKKSFTHF